MFVFLSRAGLNPASVSWGDPASLHSFFDFLRPHRAAPDVLSASTFASNVSMWPIRHLKYVLGASTLASRQREDTAQRTGIQDQGCVFTFSAWENHAPLWLRFSQLAVGALLLRDGRTDVQVQVRRARRHAQDAHVVGRHQVGNGRDAPSVGGANYV